MTSPTQSLPLSVLYWLNACPTDRPVALLLRHAARDALPPDDTGNALPITELGVRMAEELGETIGNRLLTLHSSPIKRCIQTAEHLRLGAGVTVDIVPDRLLGDPGAYVLDGKRAWVNWQELGHEGVVRHLISGDYALPGMADPGSAARLLAEHMLATAGDQVGLHIFVTHDTLVTATAWRFLGKPYDREQWPKFLEAAFFWPESGGVTCAFGGQGTDDGLGASRTRYFDV